MDPDAADPNWWTSSPKRPREEEDEDVVKFPLCHVVTAADLEYSADVAALMVTHLPTNIHGETETAKKKKRKVLHDNNAQQQGDELVSSSSGNSCSVTHVPNVESTQVQVDVVTTVPSSSSVQISCTEQQTTVTTQSHVRHFLEYNGGSLFTNHASKGQPIPTSITAPPIPCSVLNPWFLSNGIPNFSKTYQPSSSSSGDAKRKLDEIETILATATVNHSPKRPRHHGGGVVNAVSDGQGQTPTSAATLVELQNEKCKQAELETLLVSIITGDGNNNNNTTSLSSQQRQQQQEQQENSSSNDPGAKRPCRR